MNFTMSYNFQNCTIGCQTTWTKIKLSWVAVSTSFEVIDSVTGLGNYIWASSIGLSAPFTGLPTAQFPNNLFRTDPSTTTCGYMNTSPPQFDVTCTAATFPNARFITHYYIMGFQFNPAGSIALAASALLGGSTDALTAADFISVNTNAQGGPVMNIAGFGGQLAYIKIGVVITTISDYTAFLAKTALPASFVYSGVYMPNTLFNIAQPITINNPASFNPSYMSLSNAKYQIFGLTAFSIATIPSGVTVIDVNVNLPDLNTLLVQTQNVNQLSSVQVSADFWNAQLTKCPTTTTTMLNVQQKLLRSVPPLKLNEQNIIETGSALTFQYSVNENDALSSMSTTVTFSNSIYFEQFTAGMSYVFSFKLYELAATDLTVNNVPLQYQVAIGGNTIINALFPNDITTIDDTGVIQFGYIVNTPTPIITITITVSRPVSTGGATLYKFNTDLSVIQYSSVYNPANDCCTDKCPANSGLNIASSPPTCQTCGNATSGLYFNSIFGNCTCSDGYYSTQVGTGSGATQCYPCFAPLCQTCTQATPTVCSACVTGAAVNNASVCACLAGYYQNGAQCTICPYKCVTCNVGSTCTLCSDNTTRDANNSCNCLAGYYDSGSAVCTVCSALCLTCSSANNCTSCIAGSNRALVNGQCICATGYYQIRNANGSLTCGQCDSSCTACSLLPNLCSNCDASANRILGYDSFGNQVCNCIPGFADNGLGNCVQSNCNADPYCSNCQTVLTVSTCIKCIGSTNRVLVLPQQKCLCKTGFYELNGVCTSCPDGCANCTSATTCTSCVVSATPAANGTCNCQNGYYFISTNQMRYCTKCPNYCTTCQSAQICLTCATNFTLLLGACTCPVENYVNNLGQCVPCVAGCANCNSSTSCQSCKVPLLQQGNTCVNRCSPGFYQSGFVCMSCPVGCSYCEQSNICLICATGQLAYNGFCYTNCPAGSVASNSSTCVSCNSPCATCTGHPSKCTSCSSCCGSLFNFQCLGNCPVGTFSVNGTCQYCSYSCATCLGSNTTCTSCPAGKVLYNGACYAQCPYLMIGGICTFNCAKGLYKTNVNTCLPCDSTCVSCDSNPKNCTSCLTGAAYNGTCVKNCPINFLAVNGICTACNPTCYGCVNNCDNCIDCAPGYFKCGTQCLKTCYPNQFPDTTTRTCITCSSTCKTCSSQQFCTTCANPQAVPVNGICNDCSYPCNTCGSGPSVCLSCVSGFSLVGSTCIAACPTGAASINGICQCKTGAIYSGQCVTSCPSGFGNIGGQCVACAANCVSCSGQATLCTSCVTGYAFNAVTSTCQVAPTCQFGQYFSQSSNSCTRICPGNTYYFSSVCLTSCLQGYQDNGVGGCIQTQVSTGCSYPYFLSNGVCVSNCPASSYADSSIRVCSSCSANCFSCLSNTFCYACSPGYDLKNGICIASTTSCPSGQLRYNGACYATCPIGTCPTSNYCQRVCPAGSWSYNGGCYRQCPTNYTTDDACVNACPAGTTLTNGVCKVGTQTCSNGQYYNANTGACAACSYPCSRCSLTASYCTACSAGLTLSQGLCVSNNNNCGNGKYQDLSGSCQSCPEKCANCISASSCSSCATGYNFNGFDCVKTVYQLQTVKMTLSSVSRRSNTAFVTVCLNIVPNGLTNAQINQFFLVIPNTNDVVTSVNQWISSDNSKCVVAAVNYQTFPTSSAVFLAVNAQLLANSYSSIGYTADGTSFISASVSINSPQAPSTLTIPATASNSVASNSNQVPTITLNSMMDRLENIKF